MTFQQLKEQSGDFTFNQTFLDVTITPELADLLLTLNGRNRKLTKSLVRKYTNDMKEGLWKKTGQNIIISSKALVIDGQHRLEAIKASKTSQVMTIITGMDPEVFSVIDSGRNRTGSDLMSILRPGTSSRESGVLHKAMWNIINYNRGTFRFHQGSNMVIGNAKLDAFYSNLNNEDKELLETAITKGHKFYENSKNIGFMKEAHWIFLYFVLSKIDREKANTFLELLSTGQNINNQDSTSPIYLLREKLSELMHKKKMFKVTPFKIAYTFKAWNQYVDGVKLVRLTIHIDREEFPKPHAPKTVTLEAETNNTHVNHEVKESVVY